MALLPLTKRSFNGGMVSPELFGRSDTDKLKAATGVLVNFIPTVSGALIRRPGTRLLPAQAMGKCARIIHFNPSSGVNWDIGFQTLGGKTTLIFFDCHEEVTYEVPIDLWYDDTQPENPRDHSTWKVYRDIQHAAVADTLYIAVRAYRPLRIRYTGTGSPPFAVEDLLAIMCPSTVDANSAVNWTVAGCPPMEPYFAEPSKAKETIRFLPDTELTSVAFTTDVANASSIAVGHRLDIDIDGRPIIGTVMESSPLVVNDKTVRYLKVSVPPIISEVQDKTVRMYLAKNYDSRSQDRSVLRADRLVFTADNEGTWIRVPYLYGNVHSGATVQDETQPTVWHWLYIEKYLGVDNFPVAYFQDAAIGELKNYTSESVYRIAQAYSNPATIVVTLNGTAYTYDEAGDTFSVQIKVDTATPGTAPSIIEDVTTQLPMDCVVVSSLAVNQLTVVEDATLLSDTTALRIPPERMTLALDAGVSRTVELKTASVGGRWIPGSMHTAKLGDKWVSFRLIPSWTPIAESDGSFRWKAVLSDALPRDKGRVPDSGNTQDYASSLWHQNDFPGAVAVFDGRLVFGGSTRYPETIWFSSLYSHLDFRVIESDGKVLATTGGSVALSGQEVSRIRWMCTADDLIVGTDTGEWRVNSAANSRSLSAETITLKQQSAFGSPDRGARCVRIGRSIVFVSGSGRALIAYGYDYRSDSYRGSDLLDLSRNALVALDGSPLKSRGSLLTIVDIAYQRTPHPLVWCVLSDGSLLSVTYSEKQEVTAVAMHRLGAIDAEFLTPDEEIPPLPEPKDPGGEEDPPPPPIDIPTDDPVPGTITIEIQNAYFPAQGEPPYNPSQWRVVFSLDDLNMCSIITGTWFPIGEVPRGPMPRPAFWPLTLNTDLTPPPSGDDVQWLTVDTIDEGGLRAYLGIPDTSPLRFGIQTVHQASDPAFDDPASVSRTVHVRVTHSDGRVALYDILNVPDIYAGDEDDQPWPAAPRLMPDGPGGVTVSIPFPGKGPIVFGPKADPYTNYPMPGGLLP